jgi:predicted DNA-binding transcriptional regulator AlpA
MVDAEQLVGTREISERIGVGVNTVHLWRRRHPDFPQPITVVSGVHIWLWPEVQRWAEDTGRLRIGRRRST